MAAVTYRLMVRLAFTGVRVIHHPVRQIRWGRLAVCDFPSTRMRESGATLLECLVALSISLLLIGLLVKLYDRYVVASHQVGDIAAAVTAINQAKYLIKHEIKRAGYLGCAKLSSEYPIVNHTTYAFTYRNQLQGDARHLVVRHAAFPSSTLIKPMHRLDQAVIGEYGNYKAGDIVIVTSCDHSDIVEVASQVNHTIRFMHFLSGLYEAGSELSKLEENTFYIDESSDLMMRDIHHKHHRMLTGIDELHFRYIQNKHQLVAIDYDLKARVGLINKAWHDYVSL